MNIYLSIPIDKNTEATEQYDRVSVALLNCWDFANEPLVIFRPGSAYVVTFHALSQEAMDYLTDINTYALRHSDAMIVVHKPIESWGVPQEVLLAKNEEIPIFVLSSTAYDALPIYLRARVNRQNVFSSIGDLAKALNDGAE
jgi:hypothetical protein